MVHRCSMKMDDKNDGWSMWVREGPSVRRVADGGAESFILHISSCEMSSSNERTDRKVVPQSIWFKNGVDVVIG